VTLLEILPTKTSFLTFSVIYQLFFLKISNWNSDLSTLTEIEYKTQTYSKVFTFVCRHHLQSAWDYLIRWMYLALRVPVHANNQKQFLPLPVISDFVLAPLCTIHVETIKPMKGFVFGFLSFFLLFCSVSYEQLLLPHQFFFKLLESYLFPVLNIWNFSSICNCCSVLFFQYALITIYFLLIFLPAKEKMLFFY